jgi:predicted phosphoribosyltransferase
MTMAAAVRSLRAQQAAEIWICTPVAPPDLMPFLQELGDRVIVLVTPHPFNSVSRFYQEFPQVSTEEAASYLQD